MQIETVHEMGKDYMKISKEGLCENNSIMQMFRYNEVGGILPPGQRFIDGMVSFYYEITGLQSLDKYLKTNCFGKKEIKGLLSQISQICNSAKEYLIEDYEILTTPECFFVSESGNVYMPFLPVDEHCRQQTGKGLAAIMETIMIYMEHSDKELIFFVYELYKYCKEGPVSVYKLRDILDKIDCGTRERVRPHIVKPAPVIRTEIPKQEEAPEIRKAEGDDSTKKSFIIMGGFLLIGIVFIALALQSNLLRYPISGEYDRIKVMVFFVIIILSESYAASKLLKFEKKEEDGKTEVRKKGEFEDSAQTVLLRMETEMQPIMLKSMDESIKDIIVNRFPFRIGKMGSRVDGVIQHEGVSRIHGEFTCEEKAVYFRDLDSTNGTYLNNEELVPNQSIRIQTGDQLQFGVTAYEVVLLER